MSFVQWNRNEKNNYEKKKKTHLRKKSQKRDNFYIFFEQ